MKYFYIIIPILFLSFLFTIYVIKKNSKLNKIKVQKEEYKRNLYNKKPSYLSTIEIRFYKFLRKKFPRHLIFPQVNLASVINKNHQFRNELFRNIDFGIFDKDFKPICLIEINDNTHYRKDRQERDFKVKQILIEVDLPLVTIWLKDKETAPQIISKIKKAIKKGS